MPLLIHCYLAILRRMSKFARYALTAAAMALLSACGAKGPLFMPEKPAAEQQETPQETPPTDPVDAPPADDATLPADTPAEPPVETPVETPVPPTTDGNR
jgi:predicted small lipoprotein YifL